MRAITLTPSRLGPGQPDEALLLLHGQLPEGWHEVPLAAYAALASAKSVRGRIVATATICHLPSGPMTEDAGLFGAIVRAAPWLFRGPLPEDLKREPLVAHEGRQYQFVGDLHRINE